MTLNSNSITEIDLSGLVNLEILYLDNNQLTEIDLSELANLKVLDLGFNQLRGVDLSGLVNLAELRLWENQLTEIDLSELVNLEYLHLDNNILDVDYIIKIIPENENILPKLERCDLFFGKYRKYNKQEEREKLYLENKSKFNMMRKKSAMK